MSGPANILVVDDDPDMGELMRKSSNEKASPSRSLEALSRPYDVSTLILQPPLSPTS